jgi:hypothetical protein
LQLKHTCTSPNISSNRMFRGKSNGMHFGVTLIESRQVYQTAWLI